MSSHDRQVLWFAILVLTVLVLWPSPAAGYHKVEFEIVRPPEVSLEGVDTLVVLPFYPYGDLELSDWNDGSFLEDLLGEVVVEGAGEAWLEAGMGEEFAVELRTRLVERQLGTRHLFDVVRDTDTAEAVDRYRDDSHEAMDEQTAAAIGREVGAGAVLWGALKYEVDSEKSERGAKGEKCRRVSATVHARLKLIDPATGKILTTRRYSENVGESACGAERKELPTFEQMLRKTLARLSEKVPRYLAPWVHRRSLEFQKPRNGKYEEAAAQAIEAARTMDLDQAATGLEKLVADYPDDPKLHYDLGVVYEALGRLDHAEASYGLARDLKRRETYRDAIKRVKRRRVELARLTTLGISATP